MEVQVPFSRRGAGLSHLSAWLWERCDSNPGECGGGDRAVLEECQGNVLLLTRPGLESLRDDDTNAHQGPQSIERVLSAVSTRALRRLCRDEKIMCGWGRQLR